MTKTEEMLLTLLTKQLEVQINTAEALLATNRMLADSHAALLQELQTISRAQLESGEALKAMQQHLWQIESNTE